MKTILLSLVAVLLFSSCNSDDSCECNLYQMIPNSEGEIEQTLAETKSGPCTEKDISNFPIAEDINCN